MLLSNLTTVHTALGYDNTSTEMTKKFLQAHNDDLITMAFDSKDNFNKICAEIGLGPAPADSNAQ